MTAPAPAPAARVESVIAQLWQSDVGGGISTGPRPGVWAVLDGARSDKIRQLVRFSGMEQSCLYAGRLPSALESAAPYLVRLIESAHFTRDLLEAGWGNSWGIYFSSRASLETLRRHLRTFLRVRDERGQRLIFRYYDPRVLRVYLPTCTPQELDAVFGPIDTFFAEGEEGRSLLRFRRAAGGKLERGVEGLKGRD